MTIPANYKGKYFFHFTHIENLESILKNGLLSMNKKEALGIKHTDIASETIQHRRSVMDVTCPPNGKVHDYAPFYFTSTNPMLLGVLNRKNIDQPLIIYLAVSIEKLLEKNAIFTDASANTAEPPNFYNNPDDLDELDWDAIDSNKWGSPNDDERHRRMSEVLIYDVVPFDWIEAIIVYNKFAKKEVKKIFKKCKITPPKISYSPFNWKHFYFTKFYMKGREKQTLVTGPYFLKHHFTEAVKTIIEERLEKDENDFLFTNIKNALNMIGSDFCVIKEMDDIYELETENEVHNENVSDHTKKVVENLKKNAYYKNLSETDKNIAELSAYLHDIGKGPKSKWKNGKQQAYPDHPADSIPMLERILIEDFEELSEDEIRKICLLVAYHDLIGDILERGRSKKELIDLDIDEQEFDMLIAISLSDISAINALWKLIIGSKLTAFIAEIKREIG